MDDVKADANGGGYRRIEVLTGPTRRRRWSEEDKARIVAETLAPGASISDVARRWQVCSQQVFTWRREARAGSLVLRSVAAAASEPSFVPVVAEARCAAPQQEAAAPAAERSSKSVAAPTIEIRVAGDFRSALTQPKSSAGQARKHARQVSAHMNDAETSDRIIRGVIDGAENAQPALVANCAQMGR